MIEDKDFKLQIKVFFTEILGLLENHSNIEYVKNVREISESFGNCKYKIEELFEESQVNKNFFTNKNVIGFCFNVASYFQCILSL